MRKITAVTVVYDDGSTDTWSGRGTVNPVRTEVVGRPEGSTNYISLSLQVLDPPEDPAA